MLSSIRPSCPTARLPTATRYGARSFALDVLHMPGHAPDHLCFALVGKRTVFTGDHVMGWNTTVIAPPEGNMADFLASLERLMPRHDKMFLPGMAAASRRRSAWLRPISCTANGASRPSSPASMRASAPSRASSRRLYGTLDAGLKEAAALSVLAHLQQLIRRKLVFADGATELQSVFYSRPS